MLKTLKAAPRATATLLMNGPALPKLNTAMMMPKKTSRMLPDVYSDSPVIGSGSVRTQPNRRRE